MMPSHLQIDRGQALDALDGYVEAINAGRFGDANDPRRRLLGLGLEVLWRPAASASSRNVARTDEKEDPRRLAATRVSVALE